jgi:glucose dehydrogenase
MSVFGKRVLAAVVVALAAALGVSASLAGQTDSTRVQGRDGVAVFRERQRRDPVFARESDQRQATSGDLRVAWRWSARNFGPRPATQMQVSPLIVDGVMYTTAGINRDVVALDAATGQLLWHWRPTGELTRWFDIIEPLARSSGRGVTYWTDGRGDERILS